MNIPLYRIALLFIATLAFVGCETAPETPEAKENLQDQAQVALNRMIQQDPSLRNVIDNAAGYAIFPSVGKGGLVVGGAYGRGVVYEKGRFIGFAELTQGSIGLQAGGQEYSELLVFQTQDALQRFTTGQFSLGAEATAVALKAGAAATANFQNGVAVFTHSQGGLMAGISLSGQNFSFQPATQDQSTHQRSTQGQQSQ